MDSSTPLESLRAAISMMREILTAQEQSRRVHPDPDAVADVVAYLYDSECRVRSLKTSVGVELSEYNLDKAKLEELEIHNTCVLVDMAEKIETFLVPAAAGIAVPVSNFLGPNVAWTNGASLLELNNNEFVDNESANAIDDDQASIASEISATSSVRKINMSIGLFTVAEFNILPKLTLEKLNASITEFNKLVSTKYATLKIPHTKMTKLQRDRFWEHKKSSNEATKGKVFLTEREIKESWWVVTGSKDKSASAAGGGFKLDPVGRTVLALARHVGRIKEVRGGGDTRIVPPTSAPNTNISVTAACKDSATMSRFVSTTTARVANVSNPPRRSASSSSLLVTTTSVNTNKTQNQSNSNISCSNPAFVSPRKLSYADLMCLQSPGDWKHAFADKADKSSADSKSEFEAHKQLSQPKQHQHQHQLLESSGGNCSDCIQELKPVSTDGISFDEASLAWRGGHLQRNGSLKTESGIRRQKQKDGWGFPEFTVHIFCFNSFVEIGMSTTHRAAGISLPEPTLPDVVGFLDEDDERLVDLPAHLTELLRTEGNGSNSNNTLAGKTSAPAVAFRDFGPGGSSSGVNAGNGGLALSPLNPSKQQQQQQQQRPPKTLPVSPYDQQNQLMPVSSNLLGRRKTLTRPGRRDNNGDDIFNSLSRKQSKAKKREIDTIQTNVWVYTTWILTCCIPTIFIDKCLKKPDVLVQQAFREKVALCIIIFILMCIVGFLTFGFQNVVCPLATDSTIHLSYEDLKPSNSSNNIAIHGTLYTTSSSDHDTYYGANIASVVAAGNGGDFGLMFPPARSTGSCAAFDQSVYPLFPCTAVIPATNTTLWPNAIIVEEISNSTVRSHPTSICHPQVDVTRLIKWQGNLIATYQQVIHLTQSGKKVMVLNGNVLDVTPFVTGSVNTSIFGLLLLFISATFDFLVLKCNSGNDVAALIVAHVGKDATRAFANIGAMEAGYCITDYLKIAIVDPVTPNCLFATTVVWISLLIILLVVLAQFVLALYFKYAIGWTLGNNKAYKRAMADLKRRRAEFGRRAESEQYPQLRFQGRPGPDFEGGITPYNPNVGAFGAAMGPVGSIHTASSHDEDKNLDANNRNSTFIKLAALESYKNSRNSPLPATPGFSGPRSAAYSRETKRDEVDPSRNWNSQFGFMEIEGPALDAQTSEILHDPTLMHCLCLVTAYSEGADSLKATLTSIAHSYYPGTHKCLFVIADGICKGSDNDKSTPDILIDMIEVDERFPKDDPRLGGSPGSYSYVAIADGANRKNYAKVYAGWYKYDLTKQREEPKPKKSRFAGGKRSTNTTAIEMNEVGGDDETPAHMKTLKKRSQGRVPMILIVKVGNEEERNPKKPAAKPGNRGKRDSQVLLMNFLAKVMFDDRMTELEFDIFFKLFTITGVNPEKYEALLMVDADTRVFPDSLSHMIACLLKDDRVMGLCGETKISNKWDSWVTMIQVFEYYISHHMTKAFESVFGGCTCLPGCFSMYRIKTPKGPNGYWVPILANPDIVEEYSEHIVDTLHKKNLLLLGEDRFLTTIMLRTFTKRRLVFCPPAVCKTVVPDTFPILLSQRRRWINSTIHNLLELLLVGDMCGTFCISMQFVIFMNLVGTVVLPAAITFTITILILTITKTGADTELPLILLALVLGLPAVLIVMTANRPIYIFWMIIYLCSLPIWNFALPVYAFWHFDDFSWGATRRVAGEDIGHDHSRREGEFTGEGINMKRWSEWVKVRRMEHERIEYERNPALYEIKRQTRLMNVSAESQSNRGTFVPVIPGTGLVMPPMFTPDGDRGSYHSGTPLIPGPPPPGFVMPIGLPGPPPNLLISRGSQMSSMLVGVTVPAVHPYAAINNGKNTGGTSSADSESL
ncbi:Chitin synthase, class 3 [Physocladia obscura]|uniref:chitin synthase n=1 Tax=Physocladia obscura TaxID=109957 RepID=A0AAD5T7F5_9FUNG|nr:Chitin synthase, class 3 [Physocladia obscura]